MWWIFFVALTVTMAVSGIRRAQRAGQWSWSKFAFTLVFLALVSAIVTAPVLLMDMNGRYFWPVYIAAWIVALLLFVWFILMARRWKLPGGKTSLEANREQSPK
jgi:branched-subunit amino acid permease